MSEHTFTRTAPRLFVKNLPDYWVSIEALNHSLGAGLGDTLVATLLRDGWLAADAEFRAHLDPDEDE